LDGGPVVAAVADLEDPVGSRPGLTDPEGGVRRGGRDGLVDRQRDGAHGRDVAHREIGILATGVQPGGGCGRPSLGWGILVAGEPGDKGEDEGKRGAGVGGAHRK
jgi:hypothetical protein